MIIGIGVDVLEIERMRSTLERHSLHFIRHVFTAEEQAAAPEGAGVFAYYAGRWAAKEAVSKALGTGIGKACGWTDIVIHREASGRPRVELRGAGAVTAHDLGVRHIHLSISHEGRLACASAVAEG
jgi:holo-[acyl-carrier protein] synthase